MGRKRKLRKKVGRLEALMWGAAGALVATSVARELRRPPAERTWQGRVVGVPYDYRPPTVERLRSTWWAPEDERLFVPTAYGLGWDLNLGRVTRLARQRVSSDAQSNGHLSHHRI